MVFYPSTISWLRMSEVERLNELDVAVMSTEELVDWLGTYVTCGDVWMAVNMVAMLRPEVVVAFHKQYLGNANMVRVDGAWRLRPK